MALTTGTRLGPYAIVAPIGAGGMGEVYEASDTREVRLDPRFTIVSVSTTLFDEALELCASRTDKEWSLTDCISFVVMKHRRLTHALAIDKDFAQAGFHPLLRDAD